MTTMEEDQIRTILLFSNEPVTDKTVNGFVKAAIQKNHINTLKMIIYELNYDIANKMPNALEQCADSSRTDMEIIKLLVENGCDIRNEQIFLRACEHGHYEFVKLLLELGADPNTKEGAPLDWAIIKGRIKLVQLLLDYGADPNLCDETSIYALIKYGMHDILKLLLANGFDPLNLRSKKEKVYDVDIIGEEKIKKCINLLMDSGLDHTDLIGIFIKTFATDL